MSSQAQVPQRREVLKSGPFRIRYDADLISVPLALALANEDYEKSEVRVLTSLLSPDDKLLEIGGGIGVLSLHAARILGADKVTSYEANPRAARAAQRNFDLNRLDVRLIKAAVVGEAGGPRTYRDCENFLAGSLHGNVTADRGEFDVPAVALDQALEQSNATVLLMDIEGGEAAISRCEALGKLRAVVMEIHPQIIGEDSAIAIIDALWTHGLAPRADLMHGDVHAFIRSGQLDETAREAAQTLISAAAAQKRKDHPAAAEFLRQTHSLVPGNANVMDRLAQTYIAANDPDAAYGAALEFQRISPTDPMTLYWLAVSELARDHPTPALQHALQAIDLAPAAPRYRNIACHAAYKLGDRAEALKQAQRLVTMAPYAPDYLALLERESRHAGLKDQAQKAAEWKRLLESDSARGS